MGGQAPADNRFPAPSAQLLIIPWEGLQGRSPGGWLCSGVGSASLPMRGGEWHRLWYVCHWERLTLVRDPKCWLVGVPALTRTSQDFKRPVLSF